MAKATQATSNSSRIEIVWKIFYWLSFMAFFVEAGKLMISSDWKLSQDI